jgi:hypothetical protein
MKSNCLQNYIYAKGEKTNYVNKIKEQIKIIQKVDGIKMPSNDLIISCEEGLENFKKFKEIK